MGVGWMIRCEEKVTNPEYKKPNTDGYYASTYLEDSVMGYNERKL
jgi:hypothetical protein